MPYDESVAQRVREVLSDRTGLVEKTMFGGIAFMLDGHMCVGVIDQRLMARVGPDQYEAALAERHVHEMDFTGKPLRGFVYVDPPGFSGDDELMQWIARCERFVRSLPPK